jgi:hypothetical protein
MSHHADDVQRMDSFPRLGVLARILSSAHKLMVTVGEKAVALWRQMRHVISLFRNEGAGVHSNKMRDEPSAETILCLIGM